MKKSKWDLLENLIVFYTSPCLLYYYNEHWAYLYLACIATLYLSQIAEKG